MTPNEPQLPGFETVPPKAPVTADDWFAKSLDVSELFSPTAPVREADLFAGRLNQLDRMIDSIFQAGQHIVVYGDRGVGKTSLVNVVSKKIFSASSKIKFFSVQCFSRDNFTAIWERAFEDYQWADGRYAFDDIDDTLSPDSLFKIISKISPAYRPVFIFDEFDRITDQETKLRMAETIKLLSDRSAEATVILAGIARTIQELLYEHESVKRAIRQVQMPRMSETEIRSLVEQRIQRAGMNIDNETLTDIAWLARGMPGYAHLLGMYSAKAAIAEKTIDVTADHLFGSLKICLEEAGESTRQSYSKAIQSSQANNTFRHTLLACATAPQDEFGAFTATALRDRISLIVGRKRDIPDYSRHLQAFCTDERGAVLEKEGSPKNYRYRFCDPMMQSYIIMRGIDEKMMPKPTS